MTTKALLSLGDDGIILDKGDGKLWQRWGGTTADKEVPLPNGRQNWLDLARVKWGFNRVVGADGQPDPDIGDGFPTLTPRQDPDGETVYVVTPEK